MRDGIKLATSISFRQAWTGPSWLVRNPYGRSCKQPKHVVD